MKKAHVMPTGDEPPQGYDNVYRPKPDTDVCVVKGSILSQLHKEELLGLELLRRNVLGSVEQFLGPTNTPRTLKAEADVLAGKSNSDKMVFQARKDGKLVGYAFVVIGWPSHDAWVIQHMIIDVDYLDSGVGDALVEKIESYAQESDIEPNSIYAVPIQKRGIEFWHHHGYTKVCEDHLLHLPALDHEILVYTKEL